MKDKLIEYIELSPKKFKEMIANDFSINPQEELILKLPKNPKSIKKFAEGFANSVRIFDGTKEHPYMISEGVRNDMILSNARELRLKKDKLFDDIIKQTGVTLKKQKCKIYDTGGYYYIGYKYFYKNYYVEI